MHEITLKRSMPRKPRVELGEQIKFITNNVLKGQLATNWKIVDRLKSEDDEDGWNATVKLVFKKVAGQDRSTDLQWVKIVNSVSEVGSSPQFNKYPWTVVGKEKEL